ncbi:MAG: alpha/beta hydrolase, partial [Desulfamplus sp.]|nr:alpha/beta hydrolase [Desulfamplus sp.]
MIKKSDHTIEHDNTIQEFDFNFFTSKDNYRIRWGEMKPHRADSKSMGIILLLNGRSEFMEKYKPVASRLSCMGYHVLSLDWRGQGLSVRELPDRDKGYVRDFQDYLDDLDLFCNLYVLPLKQPVIIMAHSMGGHIALRFLGQYRNYENIKKAVLVAPMLDIITSPMTGRLASGIAGWGSRRLARLAVKAGFGTAYVPGNT